MINKYLSAFPNHIFYWVHTAVLGTMFSGTEVHELNYIQHYSNQQQRTQRKLSCRNKRAKLACGVYTWPRFISIILHGALKNLGPKLFGSHCGWPLVTTLTPRTKTKTKWVPAEISFISNQEPSGHQRKGRKETERNQSNRWERLTRRQSGKMGRRLASKPQGNHGILFLCVSPSSSSWPEGFFT